MLKVQLIDTVLRSAKDSLALFPLAAVAPSGSCNEAGEAAGVTRSQAKSLGDPLDDTVRDTGKAYDSKSVRHRP